METSTFDLMTDQACLDALVSHSLIEFIDDRRIKTLHPYAFYEQSQLQKVILPVLENISKTGNNTYAFNDCTNLNCLYLGSNTSSLFSLTANYYSYFLQHSAIAKGDGYIYVPDNQINNYKNSYFWGRYDYEIFPISEYPRSSNATINKTWEEIINACNDGSYKNQFVIGDTAAIELDGYRYLAQIVAIDGDISAEDTSQTAHITWLLTNLFHHTHKMNTTNNLEGWGASELRSWLNDTVLNQYFPEILQNNIMTVQKTYYKFTDKTTLISNDKLWIPSMREFGNGGYSSSVTFETNGVIYFPRSSSSDYRIKTVKFAKNTGNTSEWTTRSEYGYYASDIMNYHSFATGGDHSHRQQTTSSSLLIGFCT